MLSSGTRRACRSRRVSTSHWTRTRRWLGEGEVRVTIPRFSLSQDEFQSADSPRYLVFSTGEFELPTDRPATFAVDRAVENIGGDPADYRRAIAAFHVFDPP
jgi:hypothetical protein